MASRLSFMKSSALTGITDAPLYCATSSPSTKTLLFDSSSSAKASFNASLTANSLTPLGVAYVLLFSRAGDEDAGRRALGKDVGDREQDKIREAGREIREAAILKPKGCPQKTREERSKRDVECEVNRLWKSYSSYFHLVRRKTFGTLGSRSGGAGTGTGTRPSWH